MGKDYHVRNNCRLCSSEILRGVLNLEPTPLANEFLKPGDAREELFPLYLVECVACGHVQLPVVVDPARLFRNYVYVSGTSPAFVDHFRRYADEVWQAHNLKEGAHVVEIGSNDGTLLRFFKEKGARVLGIDPAEKIAAQASESGIDTLPHFFRETLAESIAETWGQADVVLANNVFAHADDLAGIVRGVKKLLKPGGAFAFEVQYLGDLLDGGLFDMVYHEHLSYHSVGPLLRFVRDQGLELYGVEHVNTHGGSIRCTVAQRDHRDPPYNIQAMINREGLEAKRFAAMQAQIDERGEYLRERLHALRKYGKRVAGYGAPAKATTLMRQFKIQGMIDYVIDDSPWKEGLCMPGTSIPVRRPGGDWTRVERVADVMVIFAWNFAEPILKKLRGAGFFDGERVAIVPLPEYTEVRE